MNYIEKEVVAKAINKIIDNPIYNLYKVPKNDLPDEGANIYICYRENYEHYAEGKYIDGKFIVEKRRFVSTNPSGDEGYHETYSDDVTENVVGWFEIPVLETVKVVDKYDFSFVQGSDLKSFITPEDMMVAAQHNLSRIVDYYNFIVEYIDLIWKIQKYDLTVSRFNRELSLLCKKYEIDISSS